MALPQKLKSYRYFSTGPKRYLRNCRPYFWIPLNMDHPASVGRSYAAALHDIRDHLDTAPAPYTDVFVVSHGWHRNLFAGAAAYDRLMGRLVLLLRTGRLPVTPGFNPLFLTLHWHSDPGDDAWFDTCGRRHKASFLANVREIFAPVNPQPPAPVEAQFVKDFETLFEILSQLSATEEAPQRMVARQDLRAAKALLNNYRLLGDVLPVPATIDEKCVLLWKCYHEAEPRAPLREQGDNANTTNGYLSPGSALGILLQFLISVLGIATIGGFLFTLLPRLWGWLHKIALPSAISIPFLVFALVGIPLVALLLLSVGASAGDEAKAQATLGKPPAQPAVKTPLLLLSWVVLQGPLLVPLLGAGFFAFFFGGMRATALRTKALSAQNDERLGVRGQAPPPWFAALSNFTQQRHQALSLGGLATVARFPVSLLRRALGPSFGGIPALVDAQLAFYEMSERGVVCGAQAGEAIEQLLREDRAQAPGNQKLQNARIHFIGHSFGCLVVGNAVRHLVHQPNLCAMPGAAGSGPRLQTLCFIQGALSANWFDGELPILKAFHGNIAAIFSRYDTATGFYYPLASYARRATGHVGLADICVLVAGKLQTFYPIRRPGDNGNKPTPLVLLVKPPELGITPPLVLNLDASRLIYQGAPAMGGGHDDIFKDDVVHLLWALYG